MELGNLVIVLIGINMSLSIGQAQGLISLRVILTKRAKNNYMLCIIIVEH